MFSKHRNSSLQNELRNTDVCVVYCYRFYSSWPIDASLAPSIYLSPWWRHQVETFSALLAFCEGNPPLNDGFPPQRPVTRSFDIFFDVRLNKRLIKQTRCRWFETPWRSLWRHCNATKPLPEPLPNLYLSQCIPIVCWTIWKKISETWIQIQHFLKKIHLEMSYVKWRSFFSTPMSEIGSNRLIQIKHGVIVVASVIQ